MKSATATPFNRAKISSVSRNGDTVQVRCKVHRPDGNEVLVEVRSVGQRRENVDWLDVGHVVWVHRDDLRRESDETYVVCRFVGTDGRKLVVGLPDGQVVSTSVGEAA